MFKSYYEDELQFLREMGAEFAAAYPDIAAGLGLDGRDPDVERLLQGFAFLTGRIRQSLDAQFPELLYPLLGQIWPQALRPTPAAVILEFKPRPNMLRETEVLSPGKLVASAPVDGTACLFRTAYGLPILPLRMEDVRIDAPGAGRAQLRLLLRPLPGAAFGRLGNQPLRLYFHGDLRQAYGLHSWLQHSLRNIRLRVYGPKDVLLGGERLLPPDALRPVGWGVEESLLPYPRHSFAGYRHLHEYFIFPSKYLFFDLHGLGALKDMPPTAERLEVCFELRDLLPGEPTLGPDNVRLHCVPAVNLFSHTARPLSFESVRAEHLLHAEGESPGHYDIFSVERVMGHVRRAARPVDYEPFFSFHRPPASPGERPVLYQVIQRPPVVNRSAAAAEVRSNYPSVDTYLSFIDPAGEPATPSSTVSVDLMVTNRDLPQRLRPGDISRPREGIPDTLHVSDLGPISVAAPAPVGNDGLWRFFSHILLGLNHVKDRETLRGLLTLYHFPALYNQRARQKLEILLDAIEGVSATPEDRLLGRPPTVVRGTHIEVALHESRFAHPGEVSLFGSAMSHFLAETATLNTYTRFSVRGLDQGLSLSFAPRVGLQGLV